MLNLAWDLLHLEDDDNDSLFFRRALHRLQFTGTYRHVSTVEATIQYLSGAGEYADRVLFPLPDVLVMDSSLSGGRDISELITWLATRTELSQMLRVMLTGDANPDKRKKWLGAGMSAVLLKGGSIEQFDATMMELQVTCVKTMAAENYTHPVGACRSDLPDSQQPSIAGNVSVH